jgi:putative transposase
MKCRVELSRDEAVDIKKMPRPKFSDKQEEEKTTYLARERAVELYFEMETLAEITRRTGICKQELYRFVRRFRSPDGKGGIKGFFGLDPHVQIVETRKASMGKLSLGRPVAGSFSALLGRFPEIELRLKNLALHGNEKGIKRDTERQLKIVVIHERFLTMCVEAGIEAPHYPFSLKAGSDGFPALKRWVQKIRRSRYREFLSSNDPEGAKKSAPPPDEEDAGWRAQRCFERVECDGDHLDINLVVTLPSPDEEGVVTQVYSRVWLIALIEVVSRAVLGYAIALGKGYKWMDVFRAIRSVYVPWKPKGQHELLYLYKPDDKLPNAHDQRLHGVLFDELYLDRALSQRAGPFLSALESKFGSVAVFGPGYSPDVRPHIENLNGLLNEAGIHRMPGTLGSSPSDTRRNRKPLPPVTFHRNQATSFPA